MHTKTLSNLTKEYKLRSKFPTAILPPFQPPIRAFNELDLFRKKAQHQPYSSKKSSVWVYRAIFGTFALLFTILGITTMSVPSALSIGFFSTSTALKGLVITLCTTLTLVSFLLALSMRADREAVIHTLTTARKSLDAYYLRKKVRLGLMRFWGAQRRYAKALKLMHRETLHKMKDKKEETLHLISRIYAIPSIEDERKELLLNQAVAELHDHLTRLTHTFKNDAPLLGSI